MSPVAQDMVLGLAQTYIIGLEASGWLKQGLQAYSNRPSFRHRVEMMINMGSDTETAVKAVLDTWASHLWRESVE